MAQRLLLPWAGFGNLVYRFNEIHQFVGHCQKKSLPTQGQRREAKAGNFADPRLGRPWPKSHALFKLLHGFYYSRWYSELQIEGFFDDFRPDLLVIYHLQNEAIRPYVSAARRRGIRTLGIVGSWDQPTTKGPVCPGVERYVVQGRRMRDELAKYHRVDPGKVEVIGWPQMDFYRQPGLLKPRTEFMDSLGLPAERKLILFAANSSRLGPHEPGIAANLRQRIRQGQFALPVSLVIRPHPNDMQWQERLGGLHDPPDVVALPAERGRLDFLANLLKHADVVMTTGGSMTLDAAAMDCCVVNIAFEGDLGLDFKQIIRQWYDLDHIKPVVKSGGVWVVESYRELEEAVAAYLADPARDARGRARLRAEQLEPFDGRASERLAELIAREALIG